MPLTLGSLESLLLTGTDSRHAESGSIDDDLGERLIHQILQALDFIAWNGFIHGDVNPENILWTMHRDEGFRFILGDFGLFEPGADVETVCSAECYIPPEIGLCGMSEIEAQTSKIDVWSLFVSLLWARDKSFHCPPLHYRHPERLYKIIKEHVAARPRFEGDIIYKVRAMSIWNPRLRPSAAQVILEYFNGEGLSTPQDQVQAYYGASIYEQWVSHPEGCSFHNGFSAAAVDQVELLSAELEKFHIT